MKSKILRWRFLLLWLIGCGIIISRRSDMLLNAQPWSEDSMYFLRDAMYLGWKSFITPYAGYLHLIPRALTMLSLYISNAIGTGITQVPLVMNLFAIAISAFCAVLVCSGRFEWMGNIYLRMFLSFLILAFPGAAEIYGNVTNLHWWLGIPAFLLCWGMFQNNKISSWPEIVALSLIVLTSPNGLIILPSVLVAYFCIYRFKLNKDIYKIIVLLLCTLLQLALIYTSRTNLAGGEGGSSGVVEGILGYILAGLFGDIIIGDCFTFTEKYGYLMLEIAGALLLLFMLCFSIKRFRQLYVPLTLFVIIIAITSLGKMSYVVLFKDGYTTEAQRYIFLPAVIALFILIYEFAGQFRVSGKYRVLGIGLFTSVFLLISINLFSSYKFIPFPDFQWKQRTALYQSDGVVDFFVPIYPYAYYFGYPSSCGQECIAQHIARYSGTHFEVDVHQPVFKQGVDEVGGLYTFSDENPILIFQMPGTANLAYAYLSFDRPPVVDQLQLLCLSEQGEPLFQVPITCVPIGDHLQYMIEIYPVMQKARFVQLRFIKVKNPSIVIKSLNFYALPS